MCVVERRSPLRACQAIGNDDDDDGAHFFVRFSSFWTNKKEILNRNPTTLSSLFLLLQFN